VWVGLRSTTVSPTLPGMDAGFILVEPNVRGSDGYGKTWLHADDGPKRLNVLILA